MLQYKIFGGKHWYQETEWLLKNIVSFDLLVIKIRAVAGQRSSPDLCIVTKSIKIYDP